MKITLFALPGKCGFFGAMGLANFALPPEAPALGVKKPSAESRPVRASPVKPPPASQRNSRRVRPQNWVVIGNPSIEIRKLVAVQRQQAIKPHPVRPQLPHEGDVPAH